MTGTRNMERPLYPNERDCKHGKLRRSCDLCSYESEIKAQQQEINELKLQIKGMQETESLEKYELKAHVDRLHSSLSDVVEYLGERRSVSLQMTLDQAPKQSLEAYRNSVIDECVIYIQHLYPPSVRPFHYAMMIKDELLKLKDGE